MAITESRNRNHVPRVHVYPDHVFIVVHAPEIGARGHVHYLELDQFVGENFLVTVHGPLSPKVPLEAALRETNAVAARMEAGRLRPTSPFGLTYAIVSSIARRESEMVAEIAREVGLMEQRVMAEEDEKDPQEFLSQLFAARHELLTIKTMASQGSEIYRRAIKLTTFAPPEGLELMKDVLDQYETVAHISDSQLVFLMGVTEFYRARTDTKMTIAAERLAVIAAITLPITSLSSVLGMNVIVNESTRWIPLDHPAVDHVDDIGGPAALGAQAGLVVTYRTQLVSKSVVGQAMAGCDCRMISPSRLSSASKVTVSPSRTSPAAPAVPVDLRSWSGSAGAAAGRRRPGRSRSAPATPWLPAWPRP